MECSIEQIINDCSNKCVYGIPNLDGYKSTEDNPIVVSVNECELPYVDEERSDDIRIKAFHENYYGILIALAIVDELIRRYDKDYLNMRLGSLFEYYSSPTVELKNIDMLREALVYSKETYFNECNNYANGRKCGSLLHLVIISANPFRFANVVKDCLDIDNYFSLFLSVNNNMSKLSFDTLEKFMSSKCHRDLSINLLFNSLSLNTRFLRTRVVTYK